MNNIEADLKKVKSEAWYMVYTNVGLQEGKQYLLRFSTEDCAVTPLYLQNVDSPYLTDETIPGNILLTYAYAELTFTFQTKIILSMFIIAVWLAVVARFLRTGFALIVDSSKYGKRVAVAGNFIEFHNEEEVFRIVNIEDDDYNFIRRNEKKGGTLY